MPKNSHKKHEILKKLGFQAKGSSYQFKLRQNDSLDSLLLFAKVFVMDDNMATNSFDMLNSFENIQKAWQFLHDRFMLLHLAYKTFNNAGYRNLMINRLKQSEIMILKKAEEFCRNQLKINAVSGNNN